MNRPTVHSLRTDRFHLLWDTSSDEIELFETETDPDESVNVASSGIGSELAPRMVGMTSKRLTTFGDTTGTCLSAVSIWFSIVVRTESALYPTANRRGRSRLSPHALV